jgi:hypothetical protein
MSSAAMASNINISVQQSNGTNAITVAQGGTVNYKIIGTLSDAANEGLALIGLSLDFTGGPLTVGNSPLAGASSCLEPMRAFVIPDGITNPGAGAFGGTVIGGDLIQCGGAQNTIKNTVDNAAFPIGAVLTGLAQPGGCGPAVILTGSFVVPADLAPGPYALNAFDVFANVIEDGQDGSGAFWATVAAGVGSVTPLAITVVLGDVPADFVSSIPVHTAVGIQTAPSQGTLWRSAKNTLRLTFDGALAAAPTAAQIEIIELLDGGLFGSNVAANGFTFLLESGNTVLRIRDDDATTDLVHGKWYAIRNTGGWTAAANFEIHFPVQVGDANGDGLTAFSDLGFINTQIPTFPAADNARRDVNGDVSIAFSDLGAANARVPSGLITKPTGH